MKLMGGGGASALLDETLPSDVSKFTCTEMYA